MGRLCSSLQHPSLTPCGSTHSSCPHFVMPQTAQPTLNHSDTKLVEETQTGCDILQSPSAGRPVHASRGGARGRDLPAVTLHAEWGQTPQGPPAFSCVYPKLSTTPSGHCGGIQTLTLSTTVLSLLQRIQFWMLYQLVNSNCFCSHKLLTYRTKTIMKYLLGDN